MNYAASNFGSVAISGSSASTPQVGMNRIFHLGAEACFQPMASGQIMENKSRKSYEIFSASLTTRFCGQNLKLFSPESIASEVIL